MRIAVSLVIVVALGSCARPSRVSALETRLAALEAQQARDRAELDAALVRLRDAVDRVAGSGGLDGQVAALLEELAAKIDALDAKVGKAPPARKRRPEPKPDEVYAVPADNAPSEGPADALVTIVRAYEYACPFCEKSRKTLAALRLRYPDELRIVYRPFIVHPRVATLPAQAACAAHRQGQFAAYDALLWDKAFATRTFDQTFLEQLATEAGLDLDRFRADLTGDCVAQVVADHDLMKQFGVGATPAHFINGKYLPGGALPEADFAAAIDAELAAAQARVAKAAKKKRAKARATYYKNWVLDQGLPRFDPPPD